MKTGQYISTHYNYFHIKTALTSFELGMDDFRTVQKPALKFMMTGLIILNVNIS